MSALIPDDQVEHFKFLSESTDETLVHFCKLSLEYLKDGPNMDKYSAAAGRSEDFIKDVIESLVYFLIECLRLQVSRTWSIAALETRPILPFIPDQQLGHP